MVFTVADTPDETKAIDPGMVFNTEADIYNRTCVYPIHLLPEALYNLLDPGAPPVAHTLLPVQMEERLQVQGVLLEEEHQMSHTAPVSQNEPIHHL